MSAAHNHRDGTDRRDWFCVTRRQVRVNRSLPNRDHYARRNLRRPRSHPHPLHRARFPWCRHMEAQDRAGSSEPQVDAAHGRPFRAGRTDRRCRRAVMGCRIGMATDVPARLARLRSDGLVPKRTRCRTIVKGLSYVQANRREELLRKACGPRCQGAPGGGFKPGKVWNIYRIDW